MREPEPVRALLFLDKTSDSTPVLSLAIEIASFGKNEGFP
jgi:hypothetical protein